MSRWSCNRPDCASHARVPDLASRFGDDTAAARTSTSRTTASAPRLGFSYGRTVAIAFAAAFIVTRGISVEAQAAVQPATAERPADPLLGSLSFTDSDAPLEITAGSLEFDYRTRILTYRGDVVAKQEDVQLMADTLTLDLSGAERSELQSVVAEGNVRFSQGARRARAGRAVYDQNKRLIVLSQNAVLEDERGNVSGDTVHVYLEDDRTVIEGGSGRVRAVLNPRKDDDGKAAGSAVTSEEKR